MKKYREYAVISGKGGTGKTSITASLFHLTDNSVAADCDVDAADMHLVLQPEILETYEFTGGKEAIIREEQCTLCGNCEELCRYDAIEGDGYRFTVDPFGCEGCGVCAHFCPVSAIEMKEKKAGHYYLSKTRNGLLAHAALIAGEENSGKLVSKVRETAKKTAEDTGAETIIIDGPPGTGCPVIASITGTDGVLLVTEPTDTAFSDMKRAAELLGHFNIKGAVCINKCDINLDKSAMIEDFCRTSSLDVISKIPYDTAFTDSQIAGKSISEHTPSMREAVQSLWENFMGLMEQQKN